MMCGKLNGKHLTLSTRKFQPPDKARTSRRLRERVGFGPKRPIRLWSRPRRLDRSGRPFRKPCRKSASGCFRAPWSHRDEDGNGRETEAL